jgi:predicted Zn-dependent protease
MLKRCIIYLLALFLIVACATVPITGRRQLSLVPESQVNTMADSSYLQFLATHKLSNDQTSIQMTKRVGQRIANGVQQYFAEKGQSDKLKDYKWEFNLVQDSEANAWCMPGGKVVVYTGILPLTKDDNGLAVVLGHEISHAVAQHGDERMSQALIAQLGGTALSVALKNKPQQTQQLFAAAYGIGANIGVILPYSRIQESEADRLGLIFMAHAGYDPHTALDFWKRMMAYQKGAAPPQILSDHPSDQTRINNIEKYIPEAMKYYYK